MAAAPACSSRAPGWTTPCASAWRAAIYPEAVGTRGGMDRRAARQAPSTQGAPRAEAGRRPRILIEERLTEDGGSIGLRVDITGLKEREASFRLLFDSNPVPMIVCAVEDERISAVNDAAIAHYGYGRAEFENLAIRSLHGLRQRSAMGRRTARATKLAARTWKHVKADGTLIDLAIYSRQSGLSRAAWPCCSR